VLVLDASSTLLVTIFVCIRLPTRAQSSAWSSSVLDKLVCESAHVRERMSARACEGGRKGGRESVRGCDTNTDTKTGTNLKTDANARTDFHTKFAYNPREHPTPYTKHPTP
jgi:hypothetical protein